MWRRTNNKYGAIACKYNGVKYMSQFEAKYARQLDLRLKAKDIKAWEGQIRVPLVVNGLKICVYVVDFKVTHNNGSIEWVETKGYWTSTAKLKVKLFKATRLFEFPEEKFTVIEK